MRGHFHCLFGLATIQNPFSSVTVCMDIWKAMNDDPLFLELELPSIDTNHNGIIDPEELAFFDAIQDGLHSCQSGPLARLGGFDPPKNYFFCASA